MALQTGGYSRISFTRNLGGGFIRFGFKSFLSKASLCFGSFSKDNNYQFTVSR